MNVIHDIVLADQGNVRSVANPQDARLQYIDLDGNRKKYLLEGEAGISGSNVTSINGLSGDVTLTTSDLENDSGFITASDIPVNSVNGQTGDVTINIPVSSVNGQTGEVQLDVHDIKYETVSGLALSSYVYYTVSSVLTGDILYSIPSGLHDTMVKFTTGPSATFTFSAAEDMQLNKEFNFEGEKTYVLAVDNNIAFWNELTAELEGGLTVYDFKITNSGLDFVDGKYVLQSGEGTQAVYIHENGYVIFRYGAAGTEARIIFTEAGFNQYYLNNPDPDISSQYSNYSEYYHYIGWDNSSTYISGPWDYTNWMQDDMNFEINTSTITITPRNN